MEKLENRRVIKFLVKIIFYICLVLPLNIYSQNYLKHLDNATKDVAEKFFQDFRYQFFKMAENKDITKLNIRINAIYNQQGSQTNLSAILGRKLAHYLQYFSTYGQDLILSKYIWTSVYDFNDPMAQFDSIDYNFSMTGAYEITDSSLIFTQFRISDIKSNEIFNLKTVEVPFKDTKKLLELDAKLLQQQAFDNFINFSKNANIIRWIKLSEPSDTVKYQFIDGLGLFFYPQFYKNYNLSVFLNSDAFVYVFFYDRFDPNYDFIWFIQNPNKKLKKGLNLNFLDQDLYFVPSENQQKSFPQIKIIASPFKLNIDKFLSYVSIDGQPYPVLTKLNCQKFNQYLKNFNNIQTLNINLKFKNQ